MRFSANTNDLLDSPPPSKGEFLKVKRVNHNTPFPKRQPHSLLPDVLVEIIGWLAFIDWLVSSDPYRYGSPDYYGDQYPKHVKPGYSLIRATHVCRYWRMVALENRSLWRYISFSDTPLRAYFSANEEIACRVQRSIGLTRVRAPAKRRGLTDRLVSSFQGIHVSCAVWPEAKTNFQIFHSEADQSPLRVHLPEGHDTTSDLTLIRPFSIPLFAGIVNRCTTLSLSGPGETLTTVLGPYRIGNMQLLLSLPLLTEITVELVEGTELYTLPHLPSLRKLTFIFDSPSTHFSISAGLTHLPTIKETEKSLLTSLFPSLAELSLFISNLDKPALHSFLIGHTQTLTSFTLNTTVGKCEDSDGVCPSCDEGELSHPASFALPFGETRAAVPVPDQALTWPFTSPYAYVINLHKLRHLCIEDLTAPVARHFELWACPVLEVLEFDFPSKITPPSSFLTASYTSLRGLTYRFPRHTLSRETWKPELPLEPEKWELVELGPYSDLLVSLLNNLPTLEVLVVEEWVFRHYWGEADWTEALMPPAAVPFLDYGVEYDLDCIEDDPWDPNREPTRRKKGRREKWVTQDGRQFPGKYAKYSEDGLLLDENGNTLVYAGSDSGSEEDEEGGLTNSLRLHTNSARPAKPAGPICPRLVQIKLRRCFGMERSSLFLTLRERLRLADESPPSWKDEEVCSPTSSLGSSAARSSNVSASPIRDPLAGTSFSSGEAATIEGRLVPGCGPPTPTELCAQTTVLVYECGLTDNELEGLYAQFLRGEYVVRKPRRPRPPTTTTVEADERT